MSRQVRHRVTATIVGGLLLGLPLLINGTASADQGTGADQGTAADQVKVRRQVIFTGGGVLGLACQSRPNIEAMTVPADTAVRVVNRTGHSAKLQLGKASRGTIPNDDSTEVVFHQGTTAVVLAPSCTVGDEFTPLLVTATPSKSVAMPDPIPTPPDTSDSSWIPIVPTDSDTPPALTADSVRPHAVGHLTRPHHPKPAHTGRPSHVQTLGSHPGPVVMAATTAPQSTPPASPATPIKSKTLSGTEPAERPLAARHSGADKTTAPRVPRRSSAPATWAAPEPTVALAAAEPAGPMKPMSESGPIGLLAVTAFVCVIGVAVGAIRAFVSQRA
jgi:hypothetical protein